MEVNMTTVITLKQILIEEAKATYGVTEKLFHKVAEDELQWKPATGKNWMTIGQLLMHCANFGCGKAVQGFITGDWGNPEDTGSEEQNAEINLPPAEKLLSVESVKQALELLASDKSLTLKCFAEVDESELLSKKLTAPWGGPEASLFQHLLLMITHLTQHKGQLFYYLKLMGKDVNTGDLWGM
jgi:uncharacterized damage-inducible protein DinB